MAMKYDCEKLKILTDELEWKDISKPIVNQL